MSRPFSGIARLLMPAQRRFRRSRPGSVLILVVALLVLMSLIGIAYVTSARVDRYSAKQNSFNTEVDLLLQALVQLTQRNIGAAGGAPTDTPTGPDDGHIWTSPQDSPWFGDRVPVMLAGNLPGWRYIAVSQTGAPFESPYSVSGSPVQYTTRENLSPTSVTVPSGSGTLVYPAFYDASTGQTYLAASAAGDGIADAPLFRLPVGQLDGITYYGAARIFDNSSAVNASTADAPDPAARPGQYFPANTDLLGLLVNSGSGSATQQLAALDVWRFNGNPSNSAVWTTPVADNGTALPPYSFLSMYDALWSQLGRRLGNPGLNSNGVAYRPLSMVDAVSIARHFTTADPSSNGSVLEAALSGTLVAGVRTVPYAPSQVAAWFTDNFIYENRAGNRRPITTVHNAVSNIAASRLSKKGPYDATKDYTFGDWVLYPDAGPTGRSYICVLDIDHTKNPVAPQGDAMNSALCWAPQPWVQYPLKTPLNTGTFAQLWVAYWGAMCDAANTPPAASVKAMFRNPIRSAVTVAANNNPNAPVPGNIVVTPTGGDDTSNIEAAIASSSPGSTLSFSGTYHISHQIEFAAGRTYSGGSGGGAIAALTPDETLKLRAAISAINTLQLRSNKNDVLSRTFSMGGAIQVAPGGDGKATFVTDSGVIEIHMGAGPGPTIIEGITFDGGRGIHLEGTDGLTIQHCTFKTSGQIVCAGLKNSHIDHNTFEGAQSYAVNGSPGNNVTVDDNDVDLSNVGPGGFDNNGSEWLHFVARCDGLSISHNRITAKTLRWAIELQSGMTNLKIKDNYISAQAGSGISCATGGDATPPYGHQGENIEISGNVLIDAHTPNISDCALELMGDLGLVVHDNYFGGYGTGILNGTGGQANQSAVTRNNVLISRDANYNKEQFLWTVPDLISSGDKLYKVGDPGAPGPPGIPPNDNDPDPLPTDAASTAMMSYRVTLYGSAPQPYITEVYANNDLSTNGGYVAVELYNPYSVAIPLHNWQLATIDRASATTKLNLLPLSAGLEAAVPSAQIAPHQRLIITNTTAAANPNGANMPIGVTKPPTQTETSPDLAPPEYAVIPALSKAFGQELVILRPRRTDGTLTQSTDPVNFYDEVNQLADLTPVDSYDFTGLTNTPTSDLSVEWHYIRPNDTSQGKAWHWVYPYTYTSSPAQAAGTAVQPRLTGTQSRYYDSAAGLDLSSIGRPDAAPAIPTYLDMPLEVNNTGLGANLGPNMTKTPSQYPFGGFARNGDVLNATFVGAYRIDLITINPKTQALQSQTVEVNPLTLDSAFADDMNDSDNAAENIGRFAPLHPDDSGGAFDDFSTDSTLWSSYHFAMRLFDFVTVHAPHDDYMPNTDPAVAMGAFPVANASAAVPNGTAPGVNEDNVGIEGLININTAPWRVLASLPLANSEQVAKAIVLYRDGDGAANQPHGPFTSIFQLNDVPGFRTSYAPADTAAFEVNNDYQTQFLTLGQISSLITTRSDTFTAYVIVQGWRGVGTSRPELVVQRRAAFLADRSSMTPRAPALVTRNVPVN